VNQNQMKLEQTAFTLEAKFVRPARGDFQPVR
jgi:hypothetical protein